ncbi:macro domain-containing protein [Miltoncostaea marina]|uniref:macro domain-containing protein n=1 Tax=Miltoncostaea marina TaxID=2843215 RepID=UPI001C3CAC2B|nr:macro domain-containing protein [Miltoncostaea marina]
MAIEFAVADLLAQEVDAIVNAANEHLAHGGGVAGAIAAAAGPDLVRESRELGGCPVGGAVVTTAGRLPQRAVIHAVGPVWRGGGAGEDELLAACHRAVVARAAERGFASVALPAISTGIFGYPVGLAAPVAVAALAEALAAHPGVRVARFCFLDERLRAPYREAHERLAGR